MLLMGPHRPVIFSMRISIICKYRAAFLNAGSMFVVYLQLRTQISCMCIRCQCSVPCDSPTRSLQLKYLPLSVLIRRCASGLFAWMQMHRHLRKYTFSDVTFLQASISIRLCWRFTGQTVNECHSLLSIHFALLNVLSKT